MAATQGSAATTANTANTATTATTSTFELLSPGGAEALAVSWPFREEHGLDEEDELRATFRLLSQERELVPFLAELHQKLDHWNGKSLEYLTETVQLFNQGVETYLHRQSESKPRTQASTDLIHHIMDMVYARSVQDPRLLNRYRGWSEEVYGEFASGMVSAIVSKVPITAQHKFVDLGSGVGQVVLQVAAEAQCVECVGIEKLDTPAEYAQDMYRHFVRLMSWCGKRHSPVRLIHGDFLDPAHRNLFTDFDVIFVNNFAFGPTVNQQLKDVFRDCLQNGRRVVSSLNLVPLQKSTKLTKRRTSDLSSVLFVEKVHYEGQGVSWTSRDFDYYVHTYDQSSLYRYIQRENRADVPPSPVGRSPSSRRRSLSAPGADEAQTDRSEIATTLRAGLSHSKVHLDALQAEADSLREQTLNLLEQQQTILNDQLRKQLDMVALPALSGAKSERKLRPNAPLQLAIDTGVQYEWALRARDRWRRRLIEAQGRASERIATTSQETQTTSSQLGKHTTKESPSRLLLNALVQCLQLDLDVVLDVVQRPSLEKYRRLKRRVQEQAKACLAVTATADEPSPKRAKDDLVKTESDSHP